MHNTIHPEWRELVNYALAGMDPHYQPKGLPALEKRFAAFSQPRANMRYLLLGESPYPREASANGYAFWDAAVGDLWSVKGLSKAVNRVTSLRNLMKMLLHARGDLTGDFSQEAIAALDHHRYVQTVSALFQRFIQRGFLLLNASLVYEPGRVNEHAKQWRPFLQRLLTQLAHEKHPLELILLGRIAAQLPEARLFPCHLAEHPYNLSFITNPCMLDFFRPLDLLSP